LKLLPYELAKFRANNCAKDVLCNDMERISHVEQKSHIIVRKPRDAGVVLMRESDSERSEDPVS